MAWHVTMEENGVVTLPADLLAELGWTPATPLRWTELKDGVSVVLGPAETDEAEQG